MHDMGNDQWIVVFLRLFNLQKSNAFIHHFVHYLDIDK